MTLGIATAFALFGALGAGVLLGLALAWLRDPHPVSRREAARRGLTVCAACDGAGSVPCLVCDRAGAYRDVTLEHQAERAARLGG